MRNFLIILLFTIVQSTYGQNPQFQVLLSKKVITVNGQLTVSFKFNGSGNEFTAPDNLTQNFRILSGPNKSSEMSYVNGSVSSSVSFSYVISPLNVGVFEIAPAKIKSSGKEYFSERVKIQVVNADEKAKQDAENHKKSQTKQIAKAKNNIFLRLTLNKSSVYQGEQIIATYKLYNRVRLNGIEGQRLPEFNGFYTSDIEVNNDNNHSRENINGIVYDVFVIKKTILIPQKSGKLPLIPLELDANIQIQDSKPVNTWFGPRYQYKNISISLKSNSKSVNVKPLPSGAPSSFSGAVGKFKFSTSSTQNILSVNDAITYVIKISGTGNLPLVENPTPKWPQEFEVYDPKLKSNYNNKTNKITGSKSWEFLAIPRNSGNYTIEPLEFTFFNPATKKYKTITSKQLKIEVTGSVNDGSTNNVAEINRQDVSRLGTDIRFIHTKNPELKIAGDSFFGSVWYYFWLIAPVFLSALAYIILRKQNELQSDTIGLKKRKATKLAHQLLKTAEKNLKANDKNAFYESVFKAMNGYLGNKINISNADLNKSNINSKLLSVEVTELTIKLLFETLDHCEMARFAPVTSISDPELLKQAQDVMVKLENEIK